MPHSLPRALTNQTVQMITDVLQILPEGFKPYPSWLALFRYHVKSQRALETIYQMLEMTDGHADSVNRSYCKETAKDNKEKNTFPLFQQGHFSI